MKIDFLPRVNVPMFSAAAANKGLNFTRSIQRVLDSYQYILGSEVAHFEWEFARYVGVNYCVTVANGSDALELALRSLGIQAGDLVATVANAGFYASTAIRAIGAEPVYVDVDDFSLTMSPYALTEVLEKKPKAIIVTHLYGQLADMDKLVKLADAAGIPIIEDCAQAHGAIRNGKQAGSFGDIACFSFYPTKNLGALGDGGAVVTQNEKLAEKTRQLRQYGWSQKYKVALAGGRNSRLDEIQAAILREKLAFLQGWNAERRDIARRYNEAFSELPVKIPYSLGEDYVAHLYVLRMDNRTAFAEFLKSQGVMTDIHYPIPDYQQSICQKAFSCKVTEQACQTAISMPCYPGLMDHEVNHVISATQEYFSKV